MDLVDSLRWVILSQQIYRLAVFRFDKSRTKLITDNLDIFISVVYVTALTAQISFIAQKAYFTPAENFFQINVGAKGFQLFSLIGYVEFTLTVINAMYFLFIALFKRKHQMKLIEKLQKIDDTLRFNFKMDIDYSSYKAVSVVIMLTVLLYYDIVVSGVLYFYLLDIEALSALASFGVYIVQSGTSGVFTCGYVAYVILIKVRMIKLNEKLGMIVRFPPEVLEKQYKTKEALCNEMMRYTKMYKNLCSCVEDLNQMYGSSMVLHFAHDFTLLTTQIFVMFYIGFFDRDQSLPKILALMVWLAPNIVKMTFICFNCHMTKNEIEICGLYLRKFSNEANEDELSDLVDMFSLQSIHLKTEFSANNFFSIDMSLFFTIISACTTYLVILIQFKNYEDDNVAGLHGNSTTNLTSN